MSRLLKTRLMAWALCFASVVVLSGCPGPKGDTGPTGPAGPPGVIYSGWFATGSWTVTTDAVTGAVVRAVVLSASAVTTDILDKGVVLVYAHLQSVPVIVQLPWTDTAHGAAWAYHAGIGVIVPYYSLYNFPGSDPGDAGNQFIRYVLIPGGVVTSGAREAGIARAAFNTQLRSMSYAEVCKRYEIPQ
jgi:hypothetical protein